LAGKLVRARHGRATSGKARPNAFTAYASEKPMSAVNPVTRRVSEYQPGR
jgi:hypothetical protein